MVKKDNSKDNFDDDSFDFLGKVGPKATFLIVLVALSFMVGLVWKLYTDGNTDNETVPIIQAENDSYKVRPVDPGGMEIPYQDSTLYNEQARDDNVEELFADENDEEPRAQNELFAGLNTNGEEPDTTEPAEEEPIVVETQQGADVIEDLAEEPVETVVADNQTSANTDVESRSPAPAQTQTQVEKTHDPQQLEPVREDQPEAQASTSTSLSTIASVPSGNTVVQLVALKEESAARAEWTALKKRYSPHLDGFDYRVERADLGDRGIYYRLQAGPTTRTRANQLCDRIKETNPDGCIVKAQ